MSFSDVFLSIRWFDFCICKTLKHSTKYFFFENFETMNKENQNKSSGRMLKIMGRIERTFFFPVGVHLKK